MALAAITSENMAALAEGVSRLTASSRVAEYPNPYSITSAMVNAND
jgi:hypothetical protein